MNTESLDDAPDFLEKDIENQALLLNDTELMEVSKYADLNLLQKGKS